MAALPMNVAPRTGLLNVASLLTDAAALGDDCATGDGVFLLAQNTNAAARTLTLATPQVVDGDLAVADRPFTIPATTGLSIIPVPDLYRNPVTGRAAITYDAVTGLKVCAVRIS